MPLGRRNSIAFSNHGFWIGVRKIPNFLFLDDIWHPNQSGLSHFQTTTLTLIEFISHYQWISDFQRASDNITYSLSRLLYRMFSDRLNSNNNNEFMTTWRVDIHVSSRAIMFIVYRGKKQLKSSKRNQYHWYVNSRGN